MSSDNEISLSFFGFDLIVSVKSVFNKRVEVVFYFPDGFAPNGCQIYCVRDAILKILEPDVGKVKIKAEDGINKYIEFSWMASPFCTGNEISFYQGIGFTLAHLVRRLLL